MSPFFYNLSCEHAGLVKTHFYHIWIQMKVLRKRKELARLHSVLAKVRDLL